MANTVERKIMDKDGHERTLVFGALSFGYLKANRELMQKIGVRSGSEDLIEQEQFAVESMKAGKGSDQPGTLDDFSIPDISEILIAAMEANGFIFRPVTTGSGSAGEPGK